MDKQDIQHLIQKIKSHHLPVKIEDILPKNNAHDRDLQKLLELLCYTHDVDIKIRTFSILAAYLLSKEESCKVVVTCLPMYDEIQNVFSNGLSLSNTSVLYFVSALLSFDERNGSKGSSLVMFAQNALRVSGCLATMADLFTRDMMYQDSWIALCRSVAEACRGSELNQSYCSYLVPVGIRKCHQGNTEACLVLQSLLYNNDRNIQLFLDCNGISIFSRKSLHYDMCLQLLDTTVQRSQKAATLLLETDVVYDLRSYLEIYGPEAKIGQWSTIILYHINSWSKNENLEDKKNEIETDIEKPMTVIGVADNSVAMSTARDATASTTITNQVHNNDTTKHNKTKHNPDETKELLQNIVREMAYWKIEKENKMNTTKTEQARHDLTNTINNGKNNDDTDELLQNLAGEIAYGKLLHAKKLSLQNEQLRKFAMAKNVMSQKAGLAQNPMNTTVTRHSNISVRHITFHKQESFKEHKNKRCNDLSFSFLLNQNNYMKRSNFQNKVTDKYEHSFAAKPDLTARQFRENCRKRNAKTQPHQNTSHTRLESSHSITGFQSSRDDEPSRPKLGNFKPSFASTPKRKIERMSFTRTSQPNKYISTRSTNISQLSRASFKRSKASLATKCRHWQSQQSRLDQETNKSVATSITKRQSMSARLFTAINESCTTFVKSVKGIFKGSASEKKARTDTNKDANASMCSFSFTNYMRKRDAILGENRTGENSVDMNSETKCCKTCNETALLRQKLSNDEHLRETVKKLKYGINLYGCDFKKISKSLWPNDKVMTHRVLYQLYRKLLAK